ncbi:RECOMBINATION INITIATION DEFECTS 3-RELATED [Salix viminalis]|uniref:RECOMBINATION INITIATION DEFECTS 3-RELATED n=1 Tax=Salix viminalis TaxID=40686 RepID=A0A9Q0UGW4_SALVM|nr:RECOMBINATION INITIATION DEFECTS 3-RELATED [Salix viminalis]
MKLKINKAFDLSSISFLPPQSRRSSSIPVGPQQASQIRSQQSQQSFSQGFSSQHGIFSQISQTSLDEAQTNDQRFSSQERENSAKKPSCLPVISYRREDSELPVSRSSSNLIRNWSAGPVPDHKCQMNEELHHRIGMMETSLTRFGMILDSVQSDLVQVKTGIKEESVEMEGMLKKLIVLDTSLKLMNTRQEDVKFSLEGSLKSISEQQSKDRYQDKLQQIFLVLSTLPKQMEMFVYKLQNELCTSFTKEIQAMACSMKTPLDQKSPSITVVLPKVTKSHVTPPRRTEPVKKYAKICPALPPKVETGGWQSVKLEQRSVTRAASLREQRRSGVSSDQQGKQSRVIVDSDEEIEGGFSCLIDVKETGTP